MLRRAGLSVPVPFGSCTMDGTVQPEKLQWRKQEGL